MPVIKRALKEQILAKMFKGKALIIYGARQVGKTTLVESILSELDLSILRLNGDDSDVRDLLANSNASMLKRLIGKAKVIFIDEAQRIPDIGLTIKIIVDRIPDVQVIVTGSTSFELRHTIQEPLTGRAWHWDLFPLTLAELVDKTTWHEESRNLEWRLIFGSYPEIITSPGQEIELLKLLSGSYLYRDLFDLRTVARPTLLEKITKALALQIGSEVSTIEIAQLVNADRLTVEKYIHLLEQAFIIFQLPALNRNVRNEIKKGRKIYFYDNGIRNAIIHNYTALDSRTDIGALWENYCIAERMKMIHNLGLQRNHYFWRTTQQQEVDLIEESLDNSLSLYEFTWNVKKSGKFYSKLVKERQFKD